MTEERLLQVRNLFEAALEQSPRSRLDFLQEACVGDDELFREVQVLVNGHEQSRGLLDLLPETADASPAFFGSLNLEGRRIGPYSVCEEIGRGGMGVVYSALRADGAFNKRFALKVVQYAVASEDIVARFRQEREILGRLDHPNIARLIDAGATDEGLPFYVMEYIEGQPLDSYCDERRLNVTQRIELFRSVCQAVQYAHQNLVVHRDLKPSNILVTSDGTVKLLDFGIAKVLDQSGELASLGVTLTGMRVMTPEYASPEQVRGEPITTATDLYTLGVILYELLTGQRPYHLRNRLLQEIERVICEEEPTNPSTAVDEVQTDILNTSSSSAAEKSATREGTIAKLKKRLSGDIDNILLFALRKEPSRRYSSAEQFEADLRRHLDGLPVLARKDTLAYRAQKFLSRHRLPMAVAVAFVLLLTGALLTTLHLYSSAKSAQSSAEAGAIFAWAGESLKDDPERALILGLYAWGRQRAMFPGLEQFLHDALLESRARLVLRPPKASWDPNLVESIAWSPDGSRLATGNYLGTARIWDEHTGRELIALSAGLFNVKVAWSPDGKKLATVDSGLEGRAGKSNGGTKIWEAATGRMLLSLPAHSPNFNSSRCVAWSPDGAKLATTNANTVVLLDTTTGRELLILGGNKGDIRSVTWSPDGSKLATASDGELSAGQASATGGDAKIWDTRTGQELRTLTGHGSPLAWSPDGSRLATAGEGYAVKIWEVSTERDLLALQHQSPVTSIAWSPDGSKLATVSSNPSSVATKVWELTTARELFTLPSSGTGHSVECVAWSPDGSELATGNSDGTAKIWTVAGSEDFHALRGHRFPVKSVDWSPDGKKLASTSEDGVVKIWQPTTGRELLASAGHQDSVNTVAWSPDSNKLATASPDGTVDIFETASMRNLLTLRHRFPVQTAVWSPNGSRLATWSKGKDTTVKDKFESGSDLKIWESETGRQLLTIPESLPEPSYTEGPTGFDWLPADRKSAAAQFYGTKQIPAAASGRELFTIGTVRPPGVFDPLIWKWSPDGGKLAMGQTFADAGTDGAGTAEIWNPATGRKIVTLRGGHAPWLVSLAWSPDGSKLATSGGDDTAKIWDASTGAELLTLHGHKPAVVAELDTEYGKTLRANGTSGTGARNNVNSVAWSPDGKFLASAGDDSVVQIYAIDEVELLRLVRSRITRDLTAAECKRYLNLAQCPAMPNLPESRLWHRTPVKRFGYRSMIENPYVIIFGAIAVIGIMILLLKVGESILQPDQKRLLSKGADTLMRHLSRLHAVRTLRFLNTRWGRWIRPFLITVISFAFVAQQRLFLFLGAILLIALHYTPFLSKLSERILSYCIGPLEPCFEGIQGRNRATVGRAIVRTMAFGGVCSLLMKCLMVTQAEAIKHTLFAFIHSLLSLIVFSYLILFVLLSLAFGATFACEVILRLFLAVVRRTVRNHGPVSKTLLRT